MDDAVHAVASKDVQCQLQQETGIFAGETPFFGHPGRWSSIDVVRVFAQGRGSSRQNIPLQVPEFIMRRRGQGSGKTRDG
jgi:hypothetical protein